MGSIFISYRREDIDHGVEDLYQLLVLKFGLDAVVLDKHNFVSGMEWPLQIRSHVAQADIIILAMGPAWGKYAKSGLTTATVDFVQEELELARNLGKSILPVIIKGEIEHWMPSIPAPLSWISDRQFATYTVGSKEAHETVVDAVENFIGKSESRTTKPGFMSVLKVARYASTLVSSLRYPLGVAATSLRPTGDVILSTATQVAISGLFALLVVVKVHGEASFYSFVSLLGFQFGTVLVSYLLFTMLARVTGNTIPPRCRLTFSLQFVATLTLGILVWFLVFIAMTPSEILARAVMATSNESAFQLLTDYTRDLAVWRLVVLNSVSLFIFAHLIFLVWGFARAGAVVVHWNSKLTLALMLALVSIFLAVGFQIIFSNGPQPTPTNYNVPGRILYANGSDTISPDGMNRLPLKLIANGRVEVDNRNLVVTIDTFTAENRTANPIGLSMHFNVRVLRGREYVYQDPLPYSNRVSLGTVPPNAKMEKADIQLALPLNEETVSGKTVIQLWVNDGTGDWPLNDGGSGLLTWR